MTDNPMPKAAFIEIVEKGEAGKNEAGVIVPNEIRINGIPLLAPRDSPVIVHDIEIGAMDVVKVTLTLFAQRVYIGPDLEADQ